MSLISIQISSVATVHLSWNIIGCYKKDYTTANGIKSGSISIDFWSFPDKLSNHDVSASIGRSKVDTFDRISVNTSLSEAMVYQPLVDLGAAQTDFYGILLYI